MDWYPHADGKKSQGWQSAFFSLHLIIGKGGPSISNPSASCLAILVAITSKCLPPDYLRIPKRYLIFDSRKSGDRARVKRTTSSPVMVLVLFQLIDTGAAIKPAAILPTPPRRRKLPYQWA